MLTVLFYCSFAALIAGSIPLWWQASSRKRAGGHIMEPRQRSGSPFGFIDVSVVFFFWLIGQVSSVGLAILVLDLDPESLAEVESSKLAWFAVIAGMGQLIATMGAMIFLFVRYRRIAIFGWQPEFLRLDVQLSVLAFAMVIPAILILQWLLTSVFDYHHSTLEMLANNADLLTIAASWFGAVLVAPICEEFFFRGVLQAWMQRLRPGAFSKSDYLLIGGWDPETENEPAKSYQTALDQTPTGTSWTSSSYWPIVITAALFALMHAGQGPAPIPLFFFGLVLGYLFRKTGSIVPCILLHMMLNGFSMFWFTMQLITGGSAGS